VAVKYGSLPFQEQIDFFLAKTPIPTERWNDLQRAAHDTAFMVAGATQADLLADLKEAMRKAHEEGTTLREFRKDFDSIVAKHGWTGWTGEDTAAGRAWRTRVIYETNLRASYQAGRWQQVQAVKASRPYLIYRHSHSVVSPRDEHVAWDGLVVSQDDPWVRTHWPPNGYGCKCKMFALSENDIQKMGKSGPDTPPDDGTYDWVDPRTGEIHTFPKGIQQFWDYTPGASLSGRVREQVERKIATLPEDIGKQLRAFIKTDPTDVAEKVALALGVKSVDYGSRADIGHLVNGTLTGLAERGALIPDHVRVNATAFERWAAQYGEQVDTLVAAFVPHKVTDETFLFLNPAYAHWHNSGQDSQRQFDKHMWSTNDAAHAIYHELGHLSHFKADKEVYQSLQTARFQPDEIVVARRVSRYASEAPIEFVAEVFAALLTGRSFDADIMALYQKLKGPMP
jgi:hypothetical protein